LFLIDCFCKRNKNAGRINQKSKKFGLDMVWIFLRLFQSCGAFEIRIRVNAGILGVKTPLKLQILNFLSFYKDLSKISEKNRKL
jgi:hypothetical protein